MRGGTAMQSGLGVFEILRDVMDLGARAETIRALGEEWQKDVRAMRIRIAVAMQEGDEEHREMLEGLYQEMVRVMSEGEHDAG